MYLIILTDLFIGRHIIHKFKLSCFVEELIPVNADKTKSFSC